MELRDLARRRMEAGAPCPELARLRDKLIAVGGDREKMKPEELKRFDELMDTPGASGRSVPAILNSEAEAERIRAHAAELASMALDLARRSLEEKNAELADGHRELAETLAAFVLRKLSKAKLRLTGEEAELFALLIKPNGETKHRDKRKRKTKYLTYREIAAVLGVSAMAVQRRAKALVEKHKLVAEFLAEEKIERIPRGKRNRSVTKAKKV